MMGVDLLVVLGLGMAIGCGLTLINQELRR
jgi:hypothetical protein